MKQQTLQRHKQKPTLVKASQSLQSKKKQNLRVLHHHNQPLRMIHLSRKKRPLLKQPFKLQNLQSKRHLQL